MIVELLRRELEQEVAWGFPRLSRIPQTDIIWFLDFFSTLDPAEREELIDALAASAAAAFPPAFPQTPPIAAALAHMREVRSRPGSKGGTRYMDLKMLSADRSLREPIGYHPPWREHLTPLHFQPRSDLVSNPDELRAAKAPLLRKLVRTTFRDAGWTVEAITGGGSRCVAALGDAEVTLRIDYGSMMSQLGYTVTARRGEDQSFIFAQLAYERLWDTGGRWDYITEENAPRCVAYLLDQVTYLVALGERIGRDPSSRA